VLELGCGVDIVVSVGGVEFDVSGTERARSASVPLVVGFGVEGVLMLELELVGSLAGVLSFEKAFLTFCSPALMSSPAPCIVLHPAMNTAAAAMATYLRFMSISYTGGPE
jgi:hypothetical protein